MLGLGLGVRARVWVSVRVRVRVGVGVGVRAMVRGRARVRLTTCRKSYTLPVNHNQPGLRKLPTKARSGLGLGQG